MKRSRVRGDRKAQPDFLTADAHGELLLTDHTIVNPLVASKAAKAAASALEASPRVKNDKYADDAKNMGATFTPLACSVYGLVHPNALALLRLQSTRASDAHINRIRRKAFINLQLLLSARIRCLVCHLEVQRIIHAALQKILAALPRPQGPRAPVLSLGKRPGISRTGSR
jgi:hypothetical protein